ncbi:GNAT family N-acetyltransferase [Patulibacter americanus]|uniref:GNAT family N-acetyltransferase n=1 Tax=Patulibacter americanus TaxID=588672 RepID=UPI0003B6726E|nr:GNAT family N-acetyltransferase [Patulibacter americanus]
MDGIALRPLPVGDTLEELFELDELAFHEPRPAARRARHAAVIRHEETLCAYDGDRLVGSSVVYPQSLSVPGGTLPSGAISWVGVSPTHRRRGLMRAMMEGQLGRLAAGGVPLAVLWAAEATIYSRFGFGVATANHSAKVRLRDRDSGLRDGLRPRPVRMLDPATAGPELDGAHARFAAERAGVLRRDAAWWENEVLADPEDERRGGRLRVVAAGEPADGYALYRVRVDDTQPEEASGVVDVEELVALTPQARCDLWAFLLSIDLAGRLNVPMLPVDDPLVALLRNQRTAELTEHDALWLRLLDVPAAIAGRTWSAAARLTVELEDDLLPQNAGRWRLDLGPDGGRCTRTDEPADLALPVAELGAAFLGGGSLVRAVDAGMVTEATPGAAAAFDHAARTARAPWNVTVF